MANNTLIGALRAEATLESGKFVDGAKKIRKETKATEVQVKQSFSSMGAAVKGFGGALTAGLSIGLLAGLAKKALDYASAIKTVAAQVGATTKELQEFRYAASQVGIKQEEADKGLEKFNLTLGKAAQGSKTAQAALAAVGVKLADVQTKSKPELFGQMADQIIKQGGAAKNAAALNAVLGESYSKLAPLVDKGSQGLNELAESANRLGVVLSDQQIQSADETARKLDDVRRVLAAQISGVVADNASSIVTLANALAKLTSSVVNFLGSNPQAALAIIGALAGSRFGVAGAAAGGLAGLFAGGKLSAAKDANSSDIGFLKARLQKEASILKSFQQKNARGAALNTDAQLKKVVQLTASLNRATAAGRASASSGGFGNLPQFLAGAGPKAKTGRTARTPKGPRDRSDDVAFQFDQELRRAQMDTLRAQQSLATNYEDRAAIAVKLLDLQREDQEAELQNRVRRAERDFAEGKIDASTLEQVKVQAEKLRVSYNDQNALERQAIADDLAARKAEDAAGLVDSGYDLRLEQLQNEANLKETASERREVELRILALMKEQEKARLETVLADINASKLAKDQAQARLDALNDIYAGREAGVIQGTKGPVDQFRGALDSAAKTQEAFEQLQVQGFEGLINAAGELTNGFKSAKDALLDTLKQFLAGLLKMQLQQGLASIIPAGGFHLPKFASGGSGTFGGIPGIDRNILSLNGMPIARVSYGERFKFGNDNSPSGGRVVNQNFNIVTPDANSFARSQRQMGRDARRRLGV